MGLPGADAQKDGADLQFPGPTKGGAQNGEGGAGNKQSSKESMKTTQEKARKTKTREQIRSKKIEQIESRSKKAVLMRVSYFLIGSWAVALQLSFFSPLHHWNVGRNIDARQYEKHSHRIPLAPCLQYSSAGHGTHVKTLERVDWGTRTRTSAQHLMYHKPWTSYCRDYVLGHRTACESIVSFD